MSIKFQQFLVFVLLFSASCYQSFGKGDFSGDFKSSYYKAPPLFHMYPAEDKARWTIDRIGPIGIGLDLLQPAFTMRIMQVEKGSPADKAGLKKGQYIESINGKVLKDIDPRVILGNLITEAEAKDGVLKMMVKDGPKGKAREVIVKIPVLGAYSDTWPVNCKKSDKIVRQFADFLAKHPQGWGSVLFLLSTGEEKDLEVVRGWLSGKLKGGKQGFPWQIGLAGPGICEYYLRTGDKTVLPAIQGMADYLRDTIYNGAWMGRGGCNYNYMGGGHMNGAGVHCITFLCLAKECGVDVDEKTLQSALYHFYRYAGHKNVAYGDHLSEGGGVDNGKNAGLAMGFAAAASLTPEGESSVYAKARDINANKSFYTTSWLFHGHTGGGIGELWRGEAAQVVAEKRPNMYRSFMDERRWMYELARGYDGAFGWPSGWNVNYTTTGHKGGKSWGNYIPLIYTANRKKLRIFGAPPTKYSKTYQLPKRPWGTKADEVFLSMEPGEYKPGKKQDLSKETLPTHASFPILRRLSNPKVSDDELLMFAHHPDFTSRGTAASKIKQLSRMHLIMPLLKSKDPRGRISGIRALGTELTDDQIKVLGEMISDPEESWWVNMEAMDALSRAPADKIAPYNDVLLKWLNHKDWWLKQAAIKALTPLAGDSKYYQKVIPPVCQIIANNQRPGCLRQIDNFVKSANNAGPEIQQMIKKELAKAYSSFPEKFKSAGNREMKNARKYMLDHLAKDLTIVPGGFDELYQVAKKRFPQQPLPHLDIYLKADQSQFGPMVKKVFEPIMRDRVIWQYVGNNLSGIKKEINNKMPGRYIDGLVNLYQKIGIHDYDWHLWGPRRDKIEWDYITYDPPEKKIWERGGEYGGRYRMISWPKGCEEWMKPGFDPKKHGWKTGFAPFANKDGKLAPIGSCKGENHFCGCGNPPNTFWDKEVLLMRSELDLPAVKDDCAYRLLVGGRSHVGSGEGSDVWINGLRIGGPYNKGKKGGIKPSIKGVGRRAGGRPWGPVINADFRKELANGEITFAATGFLPIHKSGVKRNYQAFWFEQMKMPKIGQQDIIKIMKATPLMTSSWQTSLNEEDKFIFDGNFDKNADLPGKWEQVGKVDNMENFDPKARISVHRNNRFKQITFKDDGSTNDPLVFYSGDMLIDLEGKQALKISQSEIDGTKYLFIESGGFRDKQKKNWQLSYYVFKQK